VAVFPKLIAWDESARALWIFSTGLFSYQHFFSLIVIIAEFVSGIIYCGRSFLPDPSQDLQFFLIWDLTS
jgi:hypothetical protein